MSDTLPELDRQSEEMPQLAEALAFYRAALPLLRRYRRAVAPLPLEPPAIRGKLDTGCPLLVGETLPFDIQTGRALFRRLARIVERLPAAKGERTKTKTDKRARRTGSAKAPHGGRTGRAEAARKIRWAEEGGHLDLPRAWQLLMAGDVGQLDRTASAMKLDPDLLRTLALYSLKPAFQMWAEELQKKADIDGWNRGICPICGSSPTLAEIQGKEGIRRLRCGLCGAGWRYPYLKCISCRVDDRLKIVSVEGEDKRYRLQACDACHGYIKMITTFDPIPADLLPVHDLATIHLDMIAGEHGYEPGRAVIGS